jgi:integrase
MRTSVSRYYRHRFPLEIISHSLGKWSQVHSSQRGCKALVIAASKLYIAVLDTGMRLGEMPKLKWSDVDLDARKIRVRAFTTKTMTALDVPISSRER